MELEKISRFWPGWQIGELIGQGSYGKVYRAFKEEHSLVSEAAIKIISIPQSKAEIDALRSEGYDLDSSKTYFNGIVEDFINEIKLMENMKGAANIVAVEDFKVLEHEDGIGWDIYIRMELLTPFSKYMKDRILSEEEVIKVALDICNALEICSKQNIIHRDIKPENIFISKFGDFKVGDFGIAKQLDKTASVMSAKGTHSYIAPEILHSQSYTQSVDIYSLGIVLYMLLNNNRQPLTDPYAPQLNYKDREFAISRRLAGEPLPPPCNASPKLAKIILSACQHNPQKRFKNATALKNALISYTGSASVGQVAAAPAYIPVQQPVQQPSQQPAWNSPPLTHPVNATPDLDKTVAVTPAPTMNPTYTQSNQPYVQTEGYNNHQYTPTPPPHNKIGIIIAIIAAILIIGGTVTGLIVSGVFDRDSTDTKAETTEDTEKDTKKKKTDAPTTDDSTAPDSTDSDTTDDDTTEPDTSAKDPEPDPIPEPDPDDGSFFVSDTEGAVFLSSDNFTAEVKNISVSSDILLVNMKFRNYSSDTVEFEIDYVDLNTIVLYNPYNIEVAPNDIESVSYYIYKEYTNALKISELEDVSSFILYYDVTNMDTDEEYSDAAIFKTENYDPELTNDLRGDMFIDEGDIKAIVVSATADSATDVTIGFQNYSDDACYMHIDKFYINGEKFDLMEGNGYYVMGFMGEIVLDDIYITDDDLEYLGITSEDIETIEFSGTVYNSDTDKRMFTFDSGVIYTTYG